MGKRYSANGFPRTCYLPDSPRGQKVHTLSSVLTCYHYIAGVEAIKESLGKEAYLHDRDVSHNRSCKHCCVE